MVKPIFYKLLFSMMFTLVFFSCENNTGITDGTRLSDDNITPVLGFPERIPADAYLNTLMMSGVTDWASYDDYYRNEVITQQEEAFYNNLQWSTISFLVKKTDFIDNAPPQNVLYYLEEILNREYINDPDVAVTLLKKQQANGLENSEVAIIARSVLAKNEEYLTADNFEKHKMRNREAFKELFDMGYDRWGKEK